MACVCKRDAPKSSRIRLWPVRRQGRGCVERDIGQGRCRNLEHGSRHKAASRRVLIFSPYEEAVPTCCRTGGQCQAPSCARFRSEHFTSLSDQGDDTAGRMLDQSFGCDAQHRVGENHWCGRRS